MDHLVRARYLIYGLVDPRTGYLRYVGKSMSGRNRLSMHLSPSHLRKRNHRTNWIKSLLAVDLRPMWVEIHVFDDPEILETAERFWIGYFRSIGFDLVNETDGGEGTRGLKHTADWKALMSRIHSGKQISAEHKRRLSEVHRGSRRPPRTEEYSINASRAHGSQPFVDQNGVVYSGSYRSVEKKLGLAAGSISRVLSGKLPRAKGFVFRYLDLPQQSR